MNPNRTARRTVLAALAAGALTLTGAAAASAVEYLPEPTTEQQVDDSLVLTDEQGEPVGPVEVPQGPPAGPADIMPLDSTAVPNPVTPREFTVLIAGGVVLVAAVVVAPRVLRRQEDAAV